MGGESRAHHSSWRQALDLSVEVRPEQPRPDTYIVDVTTSKAMPRWWFDELRASVSDVRLHDVTADGFSFTSDLDGAIEVFRRLVNAARRANAAFGPDHAINGSSPRDAGIRRR